MSARRAPEELRLSFLPPVLLAFLLPELPASKLWLLGCRRTSPRPLFQRASPLRRLAAVEQPEALEAWVE
jgi:hypothetical protein